jgi:hypothetical protein
LVTLWRRAPLWRLALLTATLGSLLFALFPPGRAVPGLARVGATPPDAGYVAQQRPPVPPSVPTIPAAPPAAPKEATVKLLTGGAAAAGDGSELDPALLGQLYRGSVMIDGFKVPLPPGEWASLANSTIKQSSATGFAHFLGRIHHRRLVGAVRIFALRSQSLPGDGFNEVKSCTENNPARLHVVIDDEMQPQAHQACWTIRNVYATPWSRWADKTVKMAFLDRAAAGDMTAKGVTYPQDFVAVTFTRTETWGLLEVMYLFSPEEAGIKSNTVLSVGDADWVAGNIVRYPEKVDYENRMKAWGTEFWPKFKAAFAAGQIP